MQDLPRFTGPNAGYIAELYERYLIDSATVSAELQAYFGSLTRGTDATDFALAEGAPLVRVRQLQSLVEAIRTRGHLAARIDPLELRARDASVTAFTEFGLDESVLEGLPADLVEGPASGGARSARAAIDRLKAVYCQTAGYEFSHITVSKERAWLENAAESGRFAPPDDANSRIALLMQLTRVEAFERFLLRSFPGQKWFSVEGNDMLVPMLDELMRNAAASPLRQVVMGMAHRGRLNVLAHIMNRPYDSVIAEFMEGYFERESESTDWGWMRDVKYHMGALTARPSDSGGEIGISLLANPSHVELVNPVVAGAVRSVQDGAHNGNGRAGGELAMGVLMHGDSAFAGQGIVAETFNLAQLAGYGTGGTIHVIVNNQIGFTSEHDETQSTIYASDMAKGFGVPVVHVNADDPETCLAAVRLAFAYRQEFQKDFVIDLVGYRRQGHNEGDEASFTQPIRTAAIAQHETVRAIWARQLVGDGAVSEAEVDELTKQAYDRLQAAKESIVVFEGQREVERARPSAGPLELATAVPAERLALLNAELHRFPDGFHLNPKLEKPFQRRLEALESGAVDWAHAEALAFASIVADGIPIRITGQDTERGTFSQRHAVLHDVEDGRQFTPLAALPSAKARFDIRNSPLSEAGVLAFEYGYSVRAPGTLVLWEAQFGDFVNNAQSVVDELIVSARSKWAQGSALALLLPHGYEGQGPNHSSAHLERFLQLAAGDNIQVASCTTAAQYFHLLRRQAAGLSTRPRPLVVMTAKSLLRHPRASSTLADFTEGSFRSVIDDPAAASAPKAVRRLVFCTGKVFVDLLSAEEYAAADHVAAVRIEDLYPFPVRKIAEILNRYDKVEDVVWLQEEPQNRGAWFFVGPRLHALLKPGVPLTYAGRPDRPAPAAGSHEIHRLQQAELVRKAVLQEPRGPAKRQRVANVS